MKNSAQIKFYLPGHTYTSTVHSLSDLSRWVDSNGGRIQMAEIIEQGDFDRCDIESSAMMYSQRSELESVSRSLVRHGFQSRRIGSMGSTDLLYFRTHRIYGPEARATQARACERQS